MKNYGAVESTVRPQSITVDKFSVWIHTDIQEVDQPDTDGVTTKMYRYTMVQYDKDEYIKILSEKNTRLEAATDELTLALAEIIGGGAA